MFGNRDRGRARHAVSEFREAITVQIRKGKIQQQRQHFTGARNSDGNLLKERNL